MSAQTFAERLKWLRTEHLDLTLKEFAERAQSSPGYIHELESSKKQNPSREFAERICSVFMVKRAWLITGAGEPFPKEGEVLGVGPIVSAVGMTQDRSQERRFTFSEFLETETDAYLIMRLKEFAKDLGTMPKAKDANWLRAIEELAAEIRRRLAQEKFDFPEVPKETPPPK